MVTPEMDFDLIQFFLDRALLSIFGLLILIVVVLVIAAYLTMEDIDMIDYLEITLTIFVGTFIVYVISIAVLTRLIEVREVLSLEDDWFLIHGMSMLFYYVFLTPLVFWSLRNIFLFTKPKVYTTLVMVSLIAIMFTFFAAI